MTLFKRKLDPYKWRFERTLGKRSFMIRRGVMPGFVAGLTFAALMLLMGQENSVFFNGIAFCLVTTPIYLGMAWVMWETNEDAFASWVVEEAARLERLRGRKGKLSA